MSIYTLAYISSLPYTDTFTRDMVQQILRNIQEVPQLSAEALAAKCFVSPSALRNFVKSLGYPSYSEFKANMKYLLNHHYDNRPYAEPNHDGRDLEAAIRTAQQALEPVLQFITDDQIQAAAQDLQRASRILLCSNTSSHAQNSFLTEMIMAGKETYAAYLPRLYTDYQERVDETTAVLFLRTGQYGDHYKVEYLADAMERGAKTIFISSAVTTADIRLADHSLVFQGVSYASYGAMDVVLNTLCTQLQL